MAGVLSNILIADQETKDAIVNVDSTLTKLYAAQVKQNKIENEREKRKQQNEKRDKADSPLSFLKKQEKDKEKKQGGLLNKLLGVVGSLGKSLGGVLKGVITKILGPLGAKIIGAITKVLLPLGGKLVSGLGKILVSGLGKIFMNPLTWKAMGLAAAVVAAVKGVVQANDSIYRSVGGTAETAKGTIFDLQDINEQKEIFNNFANEQGMTWEQKQPRLQQFEELQGQMRSNKSVADQLEGDKTKLAQNEKRLLAIKDREDKDAKRERKRLTRSIEMLTKAIEEGEINRVQGQKKATKMFQDLMISDRDLIQHQISMGRRGVDDIPEHMRDQVFRNKDGYRILIEAYTDSEYETRQSGGPISVPGSGSGDKVPMMLPTGSFVMNRNAARFQQGGMVPTLLEPGETVYGPGQWGAQHVLMNSTIPRFQEGGQVTHEVTGTGYQPGGAKDYKGRPVVLSDMASKSFKSMMDAGGVKGRDVTSSQRSKTYNDQIGGAQMSNHLFGNAVDIHGSSKAWLKDNAQQHGWRQLDPRYTTHDGHFDYVGKGANKTNIQTVKENKEKYEPGTSYPKLEGTGKGMFLPKIGGALGMLLQGIQGAFNEVFGGTALEMIGMDNPLSFENDGGGPTYGGGPTGPAPAINPIAVGGDKKDKAILNMIASVEADKRDEYGGFNTSQGRTDGRATEKTIGWLSKNANGAIGRYQHMPSFLVDRAKAAGYSEDTKFTPEVQDKMTLHFLKKDTGGMYEKWKKGDVSSESMGDELSRIWRGLPHSSGGTYPDQYAGRNEAHMSRSAMMSQMTDILKLQKGGSVNFSGGAYNRSNVIKSEDEFIKRFSSAQQPMIVPVALPAPSGVSEPASTGGHGTTPTLSAVPSTNVAIDSAYRLSIGAAFA